MHFLCALDGSAAGRHAAHVAAHLANRLHANMTLMRVVPGHDDAVRPELDRFAKVIELSCGVRPGVRVETGHPTATLLAAATTMEADLLVVGEPGGPLPHEASCPVLVVPSGAAIPVSHEVALLHDGSPSSREAAAVAGRLAACLQTKLTVIHVLPDPRAVTQSVARLHRRAVDDVEAAVEDAELEIAHTAAYRRPAADLAITLARLRPSVVVADAAVPRSAHPALLVPAGARIARGTGLPELQEAA